MSALLRHLIVIGAAMLAAAIGLMSCSDDDPVGPEPVEGIIPLSPGTTYDYAYIENAGDGDSCDVQIETIQSNTPNVHQTRWLFDYGGVFDTVYIHFGNDSAIQYIGIVPPPDTGYARLEENRLVFEDFPLFELGDIVIDLPLEHGMTWTPLCDDWQYRYQYYATAIVDDYNWVKIRDHDYRAYKITIDIHGTSTDKAWNHLIINAYIAPGVGLVAVYNTMYREEYPSGRFLGLIGWELIPGN